MNTCPKNHERFVDADKCFNLIKDLKCKLDSSEGDDARSQTEAEKLVETFKKVIDPYQEQPELLDPHLADLIKGLTSGLDDFNITSSRYHTVFKFLYQLIKVSGFKSIVRKFPHETDKLPLLTELLSKEDPQDRVNWQTRFVLTVWLSIVILTPFDLAKFDSDSTDNSISDRLYSVLMRSLRLHDSCQHVTAYCLAKFFSRPDVLKTDKHVSEFISQALNELTNVKLGIANSTDDIQLIGHLRTLAYMFKFLPRAEMKQRCGAILEVLIKTDVEKINRELVNHLVIKLIQRAGFALMPKRLATWGYRRGTRILGQIPIDPHAKPANEHVAEEPQPVNEDEEACSAEVLESILGVLFVAAQNSQTRVRWSASKGIARLASRLSRNRASDIIDMVIANFFDPTSNEYAWHAGCLTLAEMSRNGFIMEEKLEDVTRIIGQAIIYDKIKGSFAVGAHIREGACYVSWAMARAYDDHLLRPYISSISINLLCTMLFDRELQCRRAASATFQELVGRQGTFNEEGINILTNVDYQNVGQRQLTYLHLALQVASYGDKYSQPFVEHLLVKKLGHWDVQIRRLASDSLSALMLHSSHKYIGESVLPKLIETCDQDLDNNAKHGAILGLAKVIRGLVPLEFHFGQELIDFVGKLVKKCEKQLKSKQLGPNFMEAIGFLISSAEIANFSYPEDTCNILKQWEEISLAAVNNDDATLRDIGSDALLTLYRTYYKNNKTHQDRLLTIFNRSLSSPNESSRCGALRALSKLSQIPTLSSAPPQLSEGKRSEIILDADTPDIILMSIASYIAKETHEKSQDLIFAQAKAEACEAFVNFVRHLDKSRLIVSNNLLQAGYDALLAKSRDYTFDKRGDIGVVVRRASIKALQELTLYLLSVGLSGNLFTRDRVTLMMGRILQQAVSYNNSARELAAQAFYKLITSDLPDETVAHKEEILGLFERYGVNAGDEFNWRDDSTPIFVNLLAREEYCMDLWVGLMPSVGQVSDMCAKQFRDALSDYIISLSQPEQQQQQQQSPISEPSSSSSSPPTSQNKLELVFSSFLDTLEQKDLPDRLLTSGLVTTDYLLTQGLMNGIGLHLQERLVEFCWQSRGQQRKPADPKRLLSVSRILSSMLQFTGSVQRSSLQYCLTLLTNGFAKVRLYTADQLYLSIMTYQSDLESELGPGSSEALEAAMELLSSTNWADPLDKVKPVRDEICALLEGKQTSS